MRLTYHYEPDEIERVKKLVEGKLASGREFVQHRLRHNVEGAAPVVPIDDDQLWIVHLACLFTTQQRSGPDSAVTVFLEQRPFPLSLAACRSFHDVERDTLQVLENVSGIRRKKFIAEAISHNLSLLENGEWEQLHRWRDALLVQRQEPPDPSQLELEAEAAAYKIRFKQFGPKQSRNFWQILGLSRYNFVLDSRVLHWLRANLQLEDGLLTADGLGDEKYYRFVSGLLFALCQQAEVLPCLFDAAVFDSFDEGTEWRRDTVL